MILDVFTGEAAAEGESDEVQSEEQQQAVLLGLAQGQAVKLVSATPEQHFTKPPPRFTEASLVKALEELGIGRPSTYAPILKVLQVLPSELLWEVLVTLLLYACMHPEAISVHVMSHVACMACMHALP